MNFDHECFWVRLNNILLACMIHEVGHQIGASIGSVKELDASSDGIGWGSYMRVRIEIDIRKIIARGRTANLEGSRLWVPLTYEKLLKLCFRCGKIRHIGAGYDGVGDKF